MAFDVEGYRKAAKDAGFSDEQIQKDIDEETQGISAKGADANMENVKVGKDFMGIPEWLQPAVGLATAAVAGGLGLKGVQNIRERMNTPQQPAAARVEPTFGIPDIGGNPPPPPPPPGGPTQNKFTPPQGDVTDVASRPVGEARLQIGGPKALPAPEVAVPTAAAPAPTPVAPTAPTAPIVPPVAAVEAAAVAPKPVDPLVQARIDALAADQRRKDEAHAAEQRRKDEAHSNRIAKDAQRAEASNQKKQGQVKSNLSQADQGILADNAEAKARAAVVASGQPKPPTASPIGGTAIPIQGAATSPAGTPPPKAVAPAVAAPELEAKLGTPTVTTGSGMPAYQGQGDDKAKMRKEFSTLKDVPSGYVFVPNGQNMDIVRNAVGQDAFTTKLGEFGGYPNTTEAAYQQSRAINKSLGRATREEAKAAGTALGDVTPSITKKVAGSKLVKVAGVGGALISLADVASAKEARQTIGEMMLPLGLTPSTLANAELTPEIRAAQDRQMKELQKLGSPYRSVPPPSMR
jgi:hypothetical protein